MSKSWPVHEAKARFSELLERCVTSPRASSDQLLRQWLPQPRGVVGGSPELGREVVRSATLGSAVSVRAASLSARRLDDRCEEACVATHTARLRRGPLPVPVDRSARR